MQGGDESVTSFKQTQAGGQDREVLSEVHDVQHADTDPLTSPYRIVLKLTYFRLKNNIFRGAGRIPEIFY